MNDLTTRKCKPCEGGVAPLEPAQVEVLLRQLAGWELAEGCIAKSFAFRDHYQAVAFLNAVAWISHREDHHPDMALGYNSVRVAYITHAVSGLTENDFICAAKVDRLFEL
jgi:4a-hydroxytetrahydrobiopterin dehydratase